MPSPASLRGHPIHSMLVVLPAGLWLFALVCDVVYVAHWGGEAWNATALYAIGAGVVGALLAAVPGLIDLLSLHDHRVKRLGVFHMVINLVAVALFAVNFGLRLDREAGVMPPIALTIVGVLLICVSGWLGGEMVYVHGVGVGRSVPDRRPPSAA
jgi:uncharacterized membrane protein